MKQTPRIKLITLLCLILAVLTIWSCQSKPAVVIDPKEPADAIISGAATQDPIRVPSPAEIMQLELEAIYQLASSRRFEEAEGRLSRLIDQFPERTDFLLLDASLLISTGNLAKASEIIDRFLRGQPEHLGALFIKAEIERYKGNNTVRTSLLESIVRLDPKNVDALGALGNINFENRNYQRAETFYRTVLNLEPANVNSLIGLSRLQFRRREFRPALDNLNLALEGAPDDSLAYLDRSRVLYQLGRYAECEADLSRSIELLPSAWAYLERGRLYLDTGRSAEAEYDFTRATELDPKFFLPYVYRAGLYEQAGQDQAAYLDYQKVTELNKDYWFAWESMAVLAFRLGNWAEAARAFNTALNFTSNHPEYFIAAGLSLMLNGQNREARDYASRNLPKIDRSKHPVQWLLLRQIADQNISTGDIEQQITRESNLDTKAAGLFYLGQFWVARNQTELGSRYIQLSLDSNRQDTIEWRMAQAAAQRLAARN